MCHGRTGRTPLIAWFVLSFLLAPYLRAQSVTGAVVGTVTDMAGGAIPSVTVRLVSDTTGAIRDVLSDEAGNFAFNAIPPGVYTLTIEFPGFKRYEEKNIVLTASERISVGEIKLQIGAMADSITVTAGGATVQVTSGERSGVITSDEVEKLTVINRDFAALVALLPGVVENPGSEVQGFGGNGTYNVLGNRTTGNNITIDGAPTDNTNGGNTNTFISMDSVATVKVLSSNFSAEFGRKPGASIQAVTKSGSKDYHGVMYGYQRHEKLNANNFFNNYYNRPEVPYRYTTLGFNIGGPVRIPRLFSPDHKKLFFFFSTEHLREARPQGLRQVTMPTTKERRGDFSESFDQDNRLILVRDPAQSGGCRYRNPNNPADQDDFSGCFPGNIIPADRINRIGQSYLNLLPLPNFFDADVSKRAYNYVIQESLHIPKHSETVRIDYNLTTNTTLYGRFNYWWEDIQGFAVPAGNSNWGWLPSRYLNTSKGVVLSAMHIFSKSLILESSLGVTRWLEQGGALQTSDLDRLSRDKSGVNIPQFHPEINPLKLVPEASFGGVAGAASTSYASRFPLRGAETIMTTNHNLTKSTGAHVTKLGFYAERWREIKGEQGNFTGSVRFNIDNNNPNDARNPYANAMLGNFASYTESTTRTPLYGYTTSLEGFIADNWKAHRKLTLDLGVRLGWSQPFHSNRRDEAGFLPGRFDPTRQVSLIQPTIRNGQRVGWNPITGEYYPQAIIGAIAPGSGDPYNGTVVALYEKDYPQGLRYNSGIKVAPRIGFAYDPVGKGKMAIRGGFGVFYEMHERDNFSYGFPYNPPLRLDPVIYYGNLDTFLEGPAFNFPSGTSGIDVLRPIGRVMNYSFGLQKDIGFGTVVDASYVGALGRHLLQRRNLNSIPFGANFKPENRDVSRTGNNALPAAFLRPYVGYNDIYYYQNDGNSSYHSLQVTVNRRYSRRVQYGLSWTWSKAMDYTDSETGTISFLIDPKRWNYGRAGFDRTHIFKLHGIWDLPRPRGLLAGRFSRAVLDNWQLSGIATIVSGSPTGVGLSFSYANDITGSPTDGARVVVVGDPNLSRGERTFDRHFDTAAIRPPERNTVGNAPKDVFRGPGINNVDLSLFKNIPLPSERWKLQFRGEFYNTFNHTQFSSVDTGARFNQSGEQINPRFGQYTGARPPRRVQLALRLNF